MIHVTCVGLLCLALALGVLVRRFVRFPYTIAMLLAGLAVGSVFPLDVVSHELILFVFLPALVFESAFSLPVHALQRDFVRVALLAGPALVLCALGTAWAMTFLTSWTFAQALAFGALISATDPVAVVALLRELGAPRRLGLLIEGSRCSTTGPPSCSSRWWRERARGSTSSR